MRDLDGITIREFEYLTSARTGRGDCKYVSPGQFTALREFVLLNREGESQLELMRLCALPRLGEAIQATNYVGVIRLDDGMQIEVLPKIDMAPDSTCSDKQVFLDMLKDLGGDVPFSAIDAAQVDATRMPLFEVFITMFIAGVGDLVRKGLSSAYVTVRSEERFVRGKIDFSLEVKSNPVHAERLNVIYDEFMLDRPENRLIKTTLVRLRRMSSSSENVRAAARLLGAFDGVGISHNVDADLARCVSDRTTARYNSLISWCRVFLKGQSFTMFRGQNVATALLFPMERVFEDYVGKMLRRLSVPHELRRVELQAQTEWLFEGRKVRLRPDILCTCTNGRRVILDTKWKHVTGARDVATSDMYQMYAYGQRYATAGERVQHVVLLYPWHKGVEPGLMRAGRHVSRDGIQVDVFFVNLENARDSLRELVGLIADPANLEV